MNVIVHHCEQQGGWRIEVGASAPPENLSPDTARGPSTPIVPSTPVVAQCAVGPNGVTASKKEGDGATPAGLFALMEVWFRADRGAAPQTGLPVRVIGEDDGWCDDSAHPLYNRHVKLPFKASHERLWREDHAYDLCVVLDYNLANPVAGAGSAIFLHLAKPDGSDTGYVPTEGCIAVSETVLRRILAGPLPLFLEVSTHHYP